MTPIDATVLAEILRDSAQRGLSPRLTVTSGSMRPLLRPGDEVALEAVTLSALQSGDIVTVGRSAALLTHRYWGTVRVGEQVCLLTRGDQALRYDKPVAPERLVGRVQSVFRGKRQLRLDAGAGLRLNQLLARLAQQEWAWIVGPDRRRGASLPAPGPSRFSQNYGWRQRWLHRALLAGRIGLVAMAMAAARRQETDHR